MGQERLSAMTAALRRGASTMNKLTIAVATMILAGPLAFAQNTRSWVASTGSDSNPCTRAQPCATFQGALGKTSANGEIDVVDAGDYGSLTIGTGVTIDGGGMGRISQTPEAFVAAVYILNATGPVTLRNLSIQGLTAGINAYNSFIRVGNVKVSSLQASGVTFDAISIAGGTATIDRAVVQDVSDAGIVVNNSAVVEVRDSIIDNASSWGIVAQFRSTITVDNSRITNSGTAIQAGNVNNGTTGTIRLSNTTITDNTAGLVTQVGGTIISFVNNRIYGNGTDGSPTRSVYQR
jgi:hypothetical protein